jgi:galactose mutarotase-like enzyme
MINGIYEISIGNSKLVMESHGAVIAELTLGGQRILADAKRADGKRGVTHPCTPIFGPETTTHFGLPQHGPMRTSETTMQKTSDTVIVEYHIDCGTYPKGMYVKQTAHLTQDTLTLTTTHANAGDEPMPVNFGEHLYWDTPDGWEGAEVNGQIVAELAKATGVIDLQEKNTIELPGKKPVHITQLGLQKAVCWAAGSSEKGFDSTYICIEPVEANPQENAFGSPSSMIAPGTHRQTVLTFSFA